jgi:hypothetical protein
MRTIQVKSSRIFVGLCGPETVIINLDDNAVLNGLLGRTAVITEEFITTRDGKMSHFYRRAGSILTLRDSKTGLVGVDILDGVRLALFNDRVYIASDLDAALDAGQMFPLRGVAHAMCVQVDPIRKLIVLYGQGRIAFVLKDANVTQLLGSEDRIAAGSVTIFRITPMGAKCTVFWALDSQYYLTTLDLP